MFTQLPVTATEVSRSLYIPILMILSALIFTKGEKRSWRKAVEAALWGSIAFALAYPLMATS